MANYHKILDQFYPDLEWLGGIETDYAALIYLVGTPISIPLQSELDTYISYIVETGGDEKLVVVRNETGVDIPALTPVVNIGRDTVSGQILINGADAGVISLMPTFCVTKSIIPNNTSGVACITSYNINNVDTSTFTLNGKLYVAPGGGVTSVRPVGLTEYDQVIGMVTEVDALTGKVNLTIEGTHLEQEVELQVSLDEKAEQIDLDSHIADGILHFSTLDGLSDVNTLGSPALTDGDVLTWNITAGYWEPITPVGSTAAWGSITGTLSDQTDLQSELDGKVNKSGDTMTGDLTIDATDNASELTIIGTTNKITAVAVSTFDLAFIEVTGLGGNGTIQLQSMLGVPSLEWSGGQIAFNDGGNIQVSYGNVLISTTQSTAVNSLTRKDYVDDNFLPLTGGTLTGDLELAYSNPVIIYTDTAGAVDARSTMFGQIGNTFVGRVLSDDGLSFDNFLYVNRSGVSVTELVLDGTKQRLTGITTVQGTLFASLSSIINLSSVSGSLITGSALGTDSHIAFDDAAIQSKSNAYTAATLYLQPEGGNVSFGVGTAVPDFTVNATTINLNGKVLTNQSQAAEANSFTRKDYVDGAIISDHLSLTNIGTNTHTQIDTHIADSMIHFSTLDGLSDVSVPTPNDGEVLTWNNGTSLWESSTKQPKVCYRHNASIEQSLSASYITINIATDVKTDTTDYTYSANEITLLNAGWHKITYTVTIDKSGGMGTASAEHTIEVNAANVTGAESYGYSSSYNISSTKSIWYNAIVNDVVRLRSREVGGSAITRTNGCSLMIEFFG